MPILKFGLAFVIFICSLSYTPVNQELLDEINQIRVDNDLQIVVINPSLHRAARERVSQQVRQRYLSHVDPERFSEVAVRHGYVFEWIGEVLGIGYMQPHEVVVAWMDSPTHKEVILWPNWISAGIGSQEGYWVILFGDT